MKKFSPKQEKTETKMKTWAEESADTADEEKLTERDTVTTKKKQNVIDRLKAFFENECSIVHTAQAMYCHKNTMNYKMNKVKEILGYDIMSNENRTRIMVALYFMKMRG